MESTSNARLSFALSAIAAIAAIAFIALKPDNSTSPEQPTPRRQSQSEEQRGQLDVEASESMVHEPEANTETDATTELEASTETEATTELEASTETEATTEFEASMETEATVETELVRAPETSFGQEIFSRPLSVLLPVLLRGQLAQNMLTHLYNPRAVFEINNINLRRYTEAQILSNFGLMPVYRRAIPLQIEDVAQASEENVNTIVDGHTVDIEDFAHWFEIKDGSEVDGHTVNIEDAGQSSDVDAKIKVESPTVDIEDVAHWFEIKDGSEVDGYTVDMEDIVHWFEIEETHQTPSTSVELRLLERIKKRQADYETRLETEVYLQLESIDKCRSSILADETLGADVRERIHILFNQIQSHHKDLTEALVRGEHSKILSMNLTDGHIESLEVSGLRSFESALESRTAINVDDILSDVSSALDTVTLCDNLTDIESKLEKVLTVIKNACDRATSSWFGKGRQNTKRREVLSNLEALLRNVQETSTHLEPKTEAPVEETVDFHAGSATTRVTLYDKSEPRVYFEDVTEHRDIPYKIVETCEYRSDSLRNLKRIPAGLDMDSSVLETTSEKVDQQESFRQDIDLAELEFELSVLCEKIRDDQFEFNLWDLWRKRAEDLERKNNISGSRPAWLEIVLPDRQEDLKRQIEELEAIQKKWEIESQKP